MVEGFNLILAFYFAIGCVFGTLMTWGLWRQKGNKVYGLGLFCLLVIGWLPLAFISWILVPFTRNCSCLTRH